MELKKWSFIPERRVELGAGEFNIFLMGVVRRNWRKLAEPMKKYDSKLVYEFYANAWGERQRRDERKTRARGKWIHYHPRAIDEFLGNLFPDQDELCTYQRMKSTSHGFDPTTVAYTLCILDRTFQRRPGGQPKRIRRKDMRTLAQIWLTFVLANIARSGHVSDLSMLRCNLLFALIQDEIFVNVAKIISDEIQKFVEMEVNQERGKRRGALGFPALITALCAAQGIIPDTNAKIRPPINKGYIEKYCVNREEHPDVVQRPPPAPAAPPSPR